MRRAEPGGALVQIISLKSRPDLNGTYAVLLQPQSEAEHTDLEEKGRVKVTSFPKVLAVRRENVCVLSAMEVASIDWSFTDFALPGETENMSLLSLVRHPQRPVGSLDMCHDFASAVWAAVTTNAPMPPKMQLTKAAEELILNNTARHQVYILGLDQIGHHIVLETRAGMARFFQSFVKRSFPERRISFGFTGREWVTGESDVEACALPDGVIRARRRWNVPNNILYDTLRELLSLIFRLQEGAQAIADALFVQLPEGRTEQTLFDKYKIGGALAWAKELHDNPSFVTSVSHNGSLHIINSASYPGAPFHFKLAPNLVEPFNIAFEELTGQNLCGADWIKPLLFKDWQTQGKTHEMTGQVEAIGWTWVEATIPH